MHSNAIWNPPFADNFNWPTKKPTYRTLVQMPVSMRGEIRASLQPYPIWEIEYTLNYARGGEQDPNSVYQYMLGFMMSMGGQFSDFLYLDPNDNTVVNALVAIGDGSTTGFQLTRPIGAGTDIVQNLMQVESYTPPVPYRPFALYVNNTLQALGTDYTMGYAGFLTFMTAPSSGSVITWTGSYYYRLRFDDDEMEFLQDMEKLWNVASIKLKSVIL